jgi:hypothetical protein
MKLKTDYSVTVTMEEAGKALSKFVEKKTGKKVTQVTMTTDPVVNGEVPCSFVFTLQGDESNLDKETV